MDTTDKVLLGAGAALGFVLLYRSLTRPDVPADEGDYDWSDGLMERQVMAWQEKIWTHGLANRVDPGLVAAVIAVESSGRNVPRRLVQISAEDKWDWVVGLMQVRLDTASRVCDRWHEYELQDPDINLDCGTKYLRQLLDTFTALASAVSAYQMGEHGIWAEGMTPGYANPQYIRNVLEMARRFRYLFILAAPPMYIITFPKSQWDYGAALLTVGP